MLPVQINNVLELRNNALTLSISRWLSSNFVLLCQSVSNMLMRMRSCVNACCVVNELTAGANCTTATRRGLAMEERGCVAVAALNVEYVRRKRGTMSLRAAVLQRAGATGRSGRRRCKSRSRVIIRLSYGESTLAKKILHGKLQKHFSSSVLYMPDQPHDQRLISDLRPQD